MVINANAYVSINVHYCYTTSICSSVKISRKQYFNVITSYTMRKEEPICYTALECLSKHWSSKPQKTTITNANIRFQLAKTRHEFYCRFHQPTLWPGLRNTHKQTNSSGIVDAVQRNLPQPSGHSITLTDTFQH